MIWTRARKIVPLPRQWHSRRRPIGSLDVLGSYAWLIGSIAALRQEHYFEVHREGYKMDRQGECIED